MIIKIFLISSISIFISSISFSQKLKSTSSESIIFIGQAVEITYEVITDSAHNIIFEPFNKEIPVSVKKDGSVLSNEGQVLEVLQNFKDSVFLEKDRKYWMGRYIVTVWDSGVFIVPGPKISINDSTLYFEDLALKCMLVNAVEGVDLYDIKEKFTEIPPPPFNLLKFLEKNWWWITLIILTLIVYIIVKRKNRVPPPAPKLLSLKERTLLAIDSLENDKLWEKGKLKEHFVELSYIVRKYLTSRYEISLMEKTTNEIRLILAQKGLEKETVQVIIRILSSSDMVKFAKSQPDTLSILKVSNLARQVVAETSPIEFEGNE